MPKQKNNVTVYKKRKFVLQEVKNSRPLPNEKLKIFKLGKSVGSNVYQAFFPDNQETLLSMPTKFRDTIYVSNGMYVIAEQILENVKVWGEIQYVLFPDQISYIQNNDLWPEEFSEKKKKVEENYVSEDMMPTFSDSDSLNSSESESEENTSNDED